MMNQVVKEEWKDIEGYEGYYQVSNHGRVKSLSRKRAAGGKPGMLKEKILKGSINSDGYKNVRLYINGTKKTFKIHQLVADNFIIKGKYHQCINHKDGDKTNNYIENIERCTIKENIIHAFENNLNPAKLNISMSEFIVLVNQGKNANEMAEILNCSVNTIRYRANKYNIKLNSTPRPKKYDINQKELRSMLKDNTQRDIAKKIGCSESLIYLYKKDMQMKGVI